MTQSTPKHAFDTQAIHAGSTPPVGKTLVPPIYQSSTFSFDEFAKSEALFRHDVPGYVYTRLGNPNQELLASRIAALEGFDLLKQQPDVAQSHVVDGRVFSSGMAAISAAILALCKSGDVILAQEGTYSATLNWLQKLAPRYGIQVFTLADVNTATWKEAFDKQPHVRMAYIETPANPTLEVLDIAAIAELAHQHGAWLVADNTFASPYCQRPLTLGADVVVHSLTKYLSGHGTVIGGAVISRHPDFIQNQVQEQIVLNGASFSPIDSWLATVGLKTFVVRMERHCKNAMIIARHLNSHPAVAITHYPGLESHPQHALARKQMFDFGGMIAFELKGGYSAGVHMMNRVKLCTLAVSLGDVDTLICHPASMTHSSLSPEQRVKTGITDGLVRLSVGIEDAQDLIADLDQAMEGLV